jgi:hypothetical protein
MAGAASLTWSGLAELDGSPNRYPPASCSNPSNLAIMPWASVISRAVGRSAKHSRRRVATIRLCWRSVTYAPRATAVPRAATYNVCIAWP